MNVPIRLIISGLFGATVLLGGCKKHDTDTPPTAGAAHATDDDGDAHEDESHEGHDHAADESESHDADAADHDGGASSLGSVTIADVVFEVSAGGALSPNAELHIDIVQTDGPLPATVRLWIGEASGVGSLKSKADGHDNHFHGLVEAPEKITDRTALWIEVEDADGTRTAASLPLQ